MKKILILSILAIGLLLTGCSTKHDFGKDNQSFLKELQENLDKAGKAEKTGSVYVSYLSSEVKGNTILIKQQIDTKKMKDDGVDSQMVLDTIKFTKFTSIYCTNSIFVQMYTKGMGMEKIYFDEDGNELKKISYNSLTCN